MAFVSALPRWFAPSMPTMQAKGLSAELFDKSLPRHPPKADLALMECPTPVILGAMYLQHEVDVMLAALDADGQGRQFRAQKRNQGHTCGLSSLEIFNLP